MAPVLLMDFLILAAEAGGRKWTGPVGTGTLTALGCWNTAAAAELGIPLRQTVLNIEGLVRSGPPPGRDPEACRALPVVAHPDPHMDIEAPLHQHRVGKRAQHSFDAEYRMAGMKKAHTAAVVCGALLRLLSGKSLVEVQVADLVGASFLRSAPATVEKNSPRKSIRKIDLS